MKKVMKKVLLGLGILLLVFISIIVIRTVTFKSQQITQIPPAEKIMLSDNEIVNRLSQALKYKTISYTDPSEFDYGEFLKLREFINKSYPNMNKHLKKEIVNHYSLLYTWEGRNKNLKPLILAAHMDVVGIEKKTEKDWLHSPFSGDIADGKVWGRGARDNKGQAMSILEAVEYLSGKNYTPERTIYIALGHDEEVLGINGAAKIAELLESRGVKAECVLDEGGAVQNHAIPGIKGQVALIGIGEKGYLTLELSVKTQGGHSSTPPKNTSIGILSKAISRLESNPFPSKLTALRPTLEFIAADAKFPYNVISSNLWLTGGIVKKLAQADEDTNASIRTTGVVTIYGGGFKENVIPAYASATMNFRLLPGDTIDDVLKRIKKTIGDPRVKINLKGFRNNPPPISPTDTKGFETLETSIKQIFPEAICAPFLVTGGTDSKHYTGLTKNLYRFTPSIKAKDEESHGINERIPIDNYKQYISFYVQLIKNF